MSKLVLHKTSLASGRASDGMMDVFSGGDEPVGSSTTEKRSENVDRRSELAGILRKPSHVLIIGSGGREHSLAYGVAQSSNVSEVFVSPGNAGTASAEKCSNISLDTHADILAFCREKNIDLVIVGPEAPLVDGLGDALRAADITVFGPNKNAAQLEGSKAFATEFMLRHGISIPDSAVVHSVSEAKKIIEEFGGPKNIVIKADGLAGGKGVFLPDNATEATEAVEKIASGSVDGDGSQFVMQKRFHGPEVSIFVLSDGTTAKIIPIAAQDHKRIGEGDTGPNTGGMGAYAPLPESVLPVALWQQIQDISDKTVTGMAAEHTPYEGVIYIGLMLAEELSGDPIVIEYNCRFGDPETEVLIPLLVQNGVDVYDMLYKTAAGQLSDIDLPKTINGAALTICLAAAGYPDSPRKGDEILGLNGTYENTTIFHGGTKADGSTIVSSGGRVLFVTGYGMSILDASNAAKAAIGDTGVHFTGMQYRRDIGHRVLGL